MEPPQQQIKRTQKNRGFYVRMKLLQHKHGRPHEKSCFFRYYKWLLWLSLTLYFFSPYLITTTTNTNTNDNKNPTFLSKTRVVSASSRALIEFTGSDSQSHILQQTHDQQGLLSSLKDLKIYVYDLPPKYNTDWLNNERCSNHLFASEVAIHRALLTSDVRTFDPYEADLFFVPIYVSCNFSTVNGFPAIGHARSLLSSAVNLISSEYPFWNRTLGSDHVFVASHDFGACFHTMENVAIADGIPGFLKKSIILQTFGVKGKHPCQDVENVVIPPYVSPESVRTTLQRAPANGGRDIFAFFRGKMEVHPKNVSGRFYSKRVRTAIWRKYGGDGRFYLQRHRFAGYQSEIVRSVFCLCPLGWAPWSPRLVESVVLGCVPVIIADDIRLPFPEAVRWAEISLTVAERDVGKLGMIMEHVASTNLTAIQKNLMDPTVRRALLFNNQIEQGDATWQVLSALANKLDRSYRRSMASSQ
ncbi:putative glucuronoxylan glucuronosyltransferase IRX7 [Morus notabilis]|uniref:Putative glucuronoxylan glucuronosyltransferase IRX7 n=1 Tax=Morus notabilis TaxID=981085 RepID=W9S969_9ROSA|nr:probable glucuronoxylan glucuronosyltransferase IRX7 [Morus notabilis]EXC31802.1 putative glucuronoxylan glucuronosyltransferase IRX7 [Morus notabilis]